MTETNRRITLAKRPVGVRKDRCAQAGEEDVYAPMAQIGGGVPDLHGAQQIGIVVLEGRDSRHAAR